MHRISLRNAAALAGAGGLVYIVLVLYVRAAPPMWTMGVAGLMMLAGVVAWFVDYFHHSHHRKQMIDFAAAIGARFEDETRRYSRRFTSFPFGAGYDRLQRDVLSGTLEGVSWVTFTHLFHTQEETTAGMTDQVFQVTLVELPVSLPGIEFVPETLASRFARQLGRGDIDVESHAFNEHWRVVCDDPRYAHAVLTPRMVARLLEPDVAELAIRIEGSALLCWQAGRQGTEKLTRKVAALAALARRIPRHVVIDYRLSEERYYAGWERPIPHSAPEWARTPGALSTGKATGLDPGPAATGRRPGDDDGFDIFALFF